MLPMTGDFPPDYSIIIPVCNEEKIVRELHNRILAQCTSIGGRWEIVYVDDGSSDGTLAELSAISSDSRIRVVSLSRNFGSHIAIAAGLDHARGSTVIVMGGDLQDRPEDLPALIQKLQEGYDVCYAIDTSRDEPLMKRIPSALFYCVASFLGADFTVKRIFFCMNRRAADALRRCPEAHRYVPEQMDWIGFRKASVELRRDKRFAGKSNYNFRKLVELGITAICAKSQFILRIPFYFFVMSMILAVILLLYGQSAFNMSGQVVFTSVLITTLAAFQFLFISVLGEYVSRIFQESRRRPLYLVRSTIPPDLTENTRCPTKNSGR